MTRGILRLVAAAVAPMLLSGCFSAFTLSDSGYRPRGRSLAVVAGLDNEASLALARGMTDAFRRQTKFQVVPQSQVAQAVPGYPQKIKGPYTSAYFQIEADYGNTDRKKVRDLQKRIGADYVYVVWVPTATVTQGTVHQFHIIAQLFEAPEAREVGNGMYAATAGRVAGCCLVPPPTDRDKGDAVKDTSDHVAREIGEKLGMLK